MTENNAIILDHGAGGLLSKKLLDDIIIPILEPVYLGKMEDSGIISLNGSQVAITTDSFVIDPIFFRNGDIGKLSVCGTVNDIAVSGAKPECISLSYILEEGFPIDKLRKITESIVTTCQEASVSIIAGDTKVVGKGEADQIYINTTGFGTFSSDRSPLSLSKISDNDDVIVSGHVGNHGIHILSMREGLGFESRVLSDCAPLNKAIQAILGKYGDDIHYIRDLTRGGLGSIFNEISNDTQKNITLKEADIPLQHETVMAAEMLGVSPLYLANEGNICIMANPRITESLLQDLQAMEYTKHAALCGKVYKSEDPKVLFQQEDGTLSILDFLKGAELPRLC